MQYLYVIASQLLDWMTTINRVWYTREDQVTPVTFILPKKHVEKDQKRDQNMEKIMMQLDILSKKFIRVCVQSFNVMGGVEILIRQSLKLCTMKS